MVVEQVQAPNLIGGISQQLPHLRLLNQQSDVVNFLPDVIDGLSARWGTEWLGRVEDRTGSAVNVDDAKIFEFYRDSTEQYWLFVTDSAVYAMDSNGDEVWVEDATGGFPYLALGSPEPKEDFRLTPVQDTILIANRQATPAVGATSSGALPSGVGDQALIFVRSGALKERYEVFLSLSSGGGTQFAGVVTWDGVYNAGRPPQTLNGNTANLLANGSTEDIAEDLRTTLDALTGVTATRAGSVILIQTGTGVTFDTLTVGDSQGDTLLNLVHNEVPSLSVLPTVAPDGFRVTVSPDGDNSLDDYHVTFSVDDGNSTFAKGQWVESMDYGLTMDFTASTMPHKITRKFDDGAGTVTGTSNAPYFHFETVTYDARVVGDDDTNAYPSFIGEGIVDITFILGRLVFITENSTIMSEVNNIFNFFRTSVRDVLDSDRIDVDVNHWKVSILQSASTLNQRLILMTDRTQYVLDGQPILTPQTIEIAPVSEYDALRRTEPVSSGSAIYYAFQREGFCGIRAVFETTERSLGTEDITLQIPRLIKGTVEKIAASTTEDVLAVTMRDSDDRQYLYLYKFSFQGNRRVISSWVRWDFGPTGTQILHASFIENKLYCVIKRDAGTFLEVLPFVSSRADANSTWVTRLDSRMTQDQMVSVGLSGSDTLITLPYALSTAEQQRLSVVRQYDGVNAGGYAYNILAYPAANQVTIEGDHTTDDFFVGFRIPSYVDLDMTAMIRPDTQLPFINGPITLNDIRIAYDKTGYLLILVDEQQEFSNPRSTQLTQIGPFVSSTPATTNPDEWLKTSVEKVSVKYKPTNAKIRIGNLSSLGTPGTHLPMKLSSITLDFEIAPRN